EKEVVHIPPPPFDIEEDEGPPPLPPLPIEDDFQEEPLLQEEDLGSIEQEDELYEEDEAENYQEEDDEAHVLDSDEEEDEYLEEELEESEEELEEELAITSDGTDSFYLPSDVEVSEEEAPTSSLKVYGGLAISLIGIGILALALMRTIPSQRKLYDIAGRDRDALVSVMARPYKGRAIHRLRPSKDFNSLWLATNYQGDAVVYIALKAIPGRILGTEVPRLQGQALLRGKAAYFSELEVIEGESLVVGEYEYMIKGKSVGMISKIKKDNPNLSFQGKILISPFSEDNFEKKLAEYRTRLEKTVIQPVKNRLQRYQTYLGLIERIRDNYKNTLSRITKGKSIYIFENRYNEEVGPILRDLIIDDNRLHISLLNLKPEESKEYEESMNFGKDIGAIASLMVTKTRRYKKISKERTESLITFFEEKLKELEDKGNLKRKFLENELAPYK
ncbi:unnamed protein product, partial [Chrysoparadoxa australica]